MSNILVIDTSTEACSVALSFQGQQWHEFDVCPQQHSQRLLPMVDSLLKQANIELTQLDALAYGRGPGSFTGVRIATGMIQGLALGTGLPVIGISTLAAMAQQVFSLAETKKRCFCAHDARMQEVYFATYRIENDIALLEGDERVLSPEEATNDIQAGVDIGFAGTGFDAYPPLSALKISQPDSVDVLYPDAKFMLPLAQNAWQNGEHCRVDQVQPVYLREKVTWKKLPGRE